MFCTPLIASVSCVLVAILVEPNAGAWRDRLDDGIAYTDFFRAVSARIHHDHPGVAVGGPVTFCPMTGYENPQTGEVEDNTWPNFGKRLIDTALPSGLLDFFDSHAYLLLRLVV